MRLRIVAGKFSRRYILIRAGQCDFRPTKEIVRQAVCEALKEKIKGAVVADFCAGSGACGIEFISRGAKYIDFVEKDYLCYQNLKKICKQFSIENQCSIYHQDICKFLLHNKKNKYDIIYYDPPYNDKNLSNLIYTILDYLKNDGIMVYEHHNSLNFNSESLGDNNFIAKNKKYGDTIVEFIRRIE